MSAKAYLLLTNVHPQVWHGEILAKRQTVGRGAGVELKIPATFVHVSRRHAEVWADRAGLWICDLKSKAGTRINGVPLLPNKPFQLEVDDRVWLGTVELEVKNVVGLVAQHPSPTSDQGTCGLCHPCVTVFAQPSAAFQSLSPAELALVIKMSRGYNLDETCDQLCRSMHTIRTHLQTIFRKLNIRSRDQLLAILRRRMSQDDKSA